MTEFEPEIAGDSRSDQGANRSDTNDTITGPNRSGVPRPMVRSTGGSHDPFAPHRPHRRRRHHRRVLRHVGRRRPAFAVPVRAPRRRRRPAPTPRSRPRTAAELPARFKRQVVSYPTAEAPGTVIVDTPNTYPLSRARQRPGDPLRHRRRPRRLHLGRRQARRADGRVAGLAAARRDARAPALPAALHGRRPRQPARRPRHVSRPARSTASTAPTRPSPSASACPRAASA